MTSARQLKLEQKGTNQLQRAIAELQKLAQDIGRCEKIISALQTELDAVNKKHADRRTTRDDIAYLTALLECARKKLGWEKQMASLQKRTPVILEEITRLMNDPKNPPPEELRAQVLQSLQQVQTTMERLQSARAGMGA
jgi:antitoxin component HigA of HigAB toxin-antitoxin module